jgi:hypothetical protein
MRSGRRRRLTRCGSDCAGYHPDWHETVGRRHGRDETRTYLILTEPEGIRDQESWLGLKVIGMCTRARVVNGKRSDEAHYFIGSREAEAKVYGEALRNHWGIENRQPDNCSSNLLCAA